MDNMVVAMWLIIKG